MGYRDRLPQLEDRLFLTDGGIETVLIKSGDGKKYWSQFSSSLVSALKARGINVCAWQFVYGRAAAREHRGADAAVFRPSGGRRELVRRVIWSKLTSTSPSLPSCKYPSSHPAPIPRGTAMWFARWWIADPPSDGYVRRSKQPVRG